MLASTIPWMLLASAIPSMAQLSIQTFDTTNPPTSSLDLAPVATTPCLGDGCSGFPTLAPSVITDITAPISLPALTESPVGIPSGETGSPTPASSTAAGSTSAGSTSAGSTSADSTSGGAAGSTAPPASQSTGAAPPSGLSSGDHRPVLLAMTLSAISVTLGFAWTLL